MQPGERPPQPPQDPAPPAKRKPSDRAPVVRPSGRAPAAKPSSRLLSAAAPTAGAQPRTSARTTVAIRPYRAKKELIAAAGVVVLLAIAAGVMWWVRDQQQKEADKGKKGQREIYEQNMTIAVQAFEKADTLGRLYCMGTAELTVEDIKRTFAQDASVYNVLFDRAIVNRRGGMEQQQQQLNAGRLTGVTVMSNPAEERNGIQLNYGFAEHGQTPVVLATKFVPAKQGDPANKGGNIRVVVFAEKDRIFEDRLARE